MTTVLSVYLAFLNKKDCADREVIPPIDEGSKGSVFSVTYVFVVGGNN